jgi:biopolymer transport protein ExbD
MKTQTQLPEAEIPTASMADVAFLLIIFFMITLTFSVSMGLDFDPGKDEPNPPVIEPEESVLVEILGDSRLRVDGKFMTTEAMLHYLAPKLRANPEKPVILRPAGEAPYGAMVNIFDTLRSAHERLELDKAIHIALPTEREVQTLWG